MSGAPQQAGGGQVTLEVDLSAIGRSIGSLRATLGPGVRILASVKADGYGFGARAAALRAEAAGADGVALVDRHQAVEIRDAGFRGRILLYAGAPIDAEAARLAAAKDLILTVLDAADAQALSAAAPGDLAVAIKVEVGTERLGVLPAELGGLVRLVHGLPRLRVAIINAHPSLGDEAPTVVLEEQFRIFQAAIAPVVAEHPEVIPLFASSKALRRSGAMSLGAVDPGQMLYEPPLDRPMIRRMRTRLLMARPVTRGFAPEFAPFSLAGVARVGVIPYGRVDGAGRCDAARFGIRGRTVRRLGPPALEYCRIDLTDVPDAAAGDPVEIIGAADDPAIGLPVVLAVCGLKRETDLAIAIPPRVHRRIVA